MLMFKISQRQRTEQRSLRSKIFDIERKEKATYGRLFFSLAKKLLKIIVRSVAFKNFSLSSLKS